MTWTHTMNAPRANPKSDPQMDTIRKKDTMPTKDHLANTIELLEMGLLWGEAQLVAKDRDRWRGRRAQVSKYNFHQIMFIGANYIKDWSRIFSSLS